MNEKYRDVRNKVRTELESRSIDKRSTDRGDVSVEHGAKEDVLSVEHGTKLAQTDLTSKSALASKSAPPGDHRSTRRRRLLLGVLGVLVLAVASVLGIPWIRLALSTVSTDDAFVNGHVTFVAPRVHGQVSGVLVDDNNRVHKGDLLVELDKEPFRDAVAVKKAAVDIAQADLQAARATVRGIEAQARSRRWNLQHAMEDVENQISLLRARVAGLEKSRASLKLAELEFERAKQLIGSATISEQEYDRRQAALTIARAQVTQSLADVYQIRVSLGLPAQPEGGDQGKRASLAPTILPAPVGHRQPRPSDLPPSVQREEQVNGPLPQGTAPKNVSEEQRIVGERGSNAVQRRASTVRKQPAIN